MAIEEFFGDGAGAAVALPVEGTWVSGQPLSPRVADPCDLICRGDIAVVAADQIEIRAQIRSIGGGAGDWMTIPGANDRGDAIDWADKPASVPGAIAAGSPFLIHVPGGYGGPQTAVPGHDVRLQARRVGGGATTTFYAEGERRYNRDGPSLLAAIGGAAGAGASLIGAAFESRAALIVTGAYVYGNEFDAGDADFLALLVDKTLGNNPTNVDFDIQRSEDGGVTWRTLPQTDQVAAGVTTQQGMTLRTQEIGAAVGNYLYGVEIIPGGRYRVGVAFTGGGTAPTLAIDCQLIKR